MKLELSIPQRPRLIHMTAVVDLLALLFAFPLLVNQFASFGGHEVVLPTSSIILPAEEHAVVIKALPGENGGVNIWIDQELVSKEEFPSKLSKIREEWTHGGDPIAWYKRDKNLTVDQADEIMNILFKLEFRVLKVGTYVTPTETQ